MTVLVDTDILIDVALDRQPHANSAAAFLSLLENRQAQGFVAWHSLANFHYLLRSRTGAAESRRYLSELLRFLRVSPTATPDALYALGLNVPDFEDALQMAAAMACGADRIATRNLHDYRNSPVSAATAAALVGELSR